MLNTGSRRYAASLFGLGAGLFALSVTSLGGVESTGPDGGPPPEQQITNIVGMKLRLIPAGQFIMGSPEREMGRDPDEGPQRTVTLIRSFYLGVYPVTQEEYRRVTGNNPSHFAAGGRGKEAVARLDTSRFPVEVVSWDEAVAFCDKLSNLPEEKKEGRVYRLPTEAEWEYACRAGTTTAFWWGDTAASTQANFNGTFPYGRMDRGPYLGRPCPVGSYKPNPWGLHDMHGNIWQWCSDWYAKDYYRSGDSTDPQGPQQGGHRVLRGGTWEGLGVDCRAARRYRYGPNIRLITFGFRVAASTAKTPG